MQTKHLCVLIHIIIKVRLVLLNMFNPSIIIFLLTNPRQCFFCGSFLLFCVMFSFCYGVPGQVWYLILSIPDFFLLLYFDLNMHVQGYHQHQWPLPGSCLNTIIIKDYHY